MNVIVTNQLVDLEASTDIIGGNIEMENVWYDSIKMISIKHLYLVSWY